MYPPSVTGDVLGQAVILDALPHALVVLDASHRIRSANASFRRLLDAAPASLTQAPFFELAGGVFDVPSLRERIAAGGDRPSHPHPEVSVTFPDAGRRIFLVDVRCVDLPEPGCLLVVLEDFTERLGNVARLRRRAVIFESMNEAVLVTSAKFIVEDWNSAAERLFGWSASEAIGKEAKEIIATEGFDREQGRRQLLLGEGVHGLMRAKSRAGEWLDVAFSARAVLTDGRVTSIVSIMQDVTEQRRLEREAEKRLRDLEYANRELESFSYSVSHDLRSPVRAIEGFSRILEEEHCRNADDEAKKVLAVVRKNALRLGSLIDDLLDFSRLGRKPMRDDDVDMKKLAREALDDACAAEPGRSYDVRLGDVLDAHGDPGLLEQVWRNLSANAVKYSRGRDPAVIEIDSELEGTSIVYRVRDNGVGFDMQYASKLFGVFQRLHKQTEFEGTGVGLALVERIVRRHGGRTWAEAKVGVGATFYFSLPTNKDPSSGRGTTSLAPPPGTP